MEIRGVSPLRGYTSSAPSGAPVSLRAGRVCFVIIVKKVGFIFVLRAEMLHFY